MKNLLVWIRISLLVLLVCIFTGKITSNTPILGKIIYPIFAPLIDEINQIIREKEISGLMDFFTVMISILASASLFMMKVKNIAQADIKSDKLKISLIQANLYFNENGRLVKRIEKLTKSDIDGDGELANTGEAVVNKGLIHGTIDAVKEFFVIATTNLSEDETYDETLEKTNLKEASSELNKLDKELKIGAFNMAADSVIRDLNSKEEKAKYDDNLNAIEKVERISLIQKMKNKLQKKKEEKAAALAESTSDIEVIDNNIEKDSKIKENKKEKEIKKTETAAPVVAPKANQPIIPNSSRDAKADFLKRLTKK